MSELEDLKKLVYSEDWDTLLWSDEDVNGFSYVDGEHEETGRWHQYMKVIVSSPSGQHYAFRYAVGLTERDEPQTPKDMGSTVAKVRREEETVVRVKWIEVH